MRRARCLFITSFIIKFIIRLQRSSQLYLIIISRFPMFITLIYKLSLILFIYILSIFISLLISMFFLSQLLPSSMFREISYFLISILFQLIYLGKINVVSVPKLIITLALSLLTSMSIVILFSMQQVPILASLICFYYLERLYLFLYNISVFFLVLTFQVLQGNNFVLAQLRSALYSYLQYKR